MLRHANKVTVVNAHLMQCGRKPKRAVELFQPRDALRCDIFLCAKILRDVKHAHGKLGKLLCAAAGQHVFHPRWKNDRKPGAMRDIVKRAKLVLQLVAGPVAHAPGLEQRVVGEAARPHDFGARVIIVRLLHHDGGVAHDGSERALRHSVDQLDVFRLRKVAFHHVRHDIHAAAGSLEGGQGIGVFGIQNGEFRNIQRRVAPALAQILLAGDDAGITHLAAGGGNGKHNAKR